LSEDQGGHHFWRHIATLKPPRTPKKSGVKRFANKREKRRLPEKKKGSRGGSACQKKVPRLKGGDRPGRHALKGLLSGV